MKLSVIIQETSFYNCWIKSITLTTNSVISSDFRKLKLSEKPTYLPYMACGGLKSAEKKIDTRLLNRHHSVRVRITDFAMEIANYVKTVYGIFEEWKEPRDKNWNPYRTRPCQ